MNVLAIGAHPDDIELGCGGALLAHRARGDAISLLVMTSGERGPQDARSRIEEQEEAAALLGAELFWGGFADGAVPSGRSGVSVIEATIAATGADVIYTHLADDSHQDHRATAMATVAAARRRSRVLMYEGPTSIGFRPDVFVDIDGLVEPKLDLLRAHLSQVLKNGLVDLEAVAAQARYYGFLARVRFAEAFTVERFVWDIAPSRVDVSDRALAAAAH